MVVFAQVSILVLLDLPWEARSTRRIFGLMSCFNPCFVGFALGGETGPLEIRIYQLGFNPCFVGFALGGNYPAIQGNNSRVVSILFLLDLPWEAQNLFFILW